MSHYSQNSGMTRVDFFKPSGKWYMTEAWDMNRFYNCSTPIDAVIETLSETERGRGLLERYIIVVIEPFNQYSYPVCLVPKKEEVMNTELKMLKSVNRLTKWKSVYAGWQLGTRGADDPECNAIRDHRELSLILRAEVNTLTGLLLEKGIITKEELQVSIAEEADQYSKDLEARFPGFTPTDVGMTINVKLAQQTMKGWKP